MIWTLGAPGRLHWQNFGPEWVIFDQPSGQTLLIDTLSAAALMALETADMTLEAMRVQVAGDLELPASGSWLAELVENLAFLESLGLVEQRTS